MKNNKTIDFKGTVGTFSTLTVSVRSNDLVTVERDLHELCDGTPDFFNEDLALIDAGELPDHGLHLDWRGLVALLRGVRLTPVAVRHAATEAEGSIRQAGLTLAEEIEITPRKHASAPATVAETPSATSSPPTNPAKAVTAAPASEPLQPELALEPSPPPPASHTPPPAPPPAPAPTPVSTMLIDRPLRSGQQIYARHTDLVVLAMVNPGAEVAADGNIHVYAPLRGRAMAGANGNTEARILTTCFEAELVSIAGVYRPLEPGMPKDVSGKPAQVRLVTSADGKQTLHIEALKIV